MMRPVPKNHLRRRRPPADIFDTFHRGKDKKGGAGKKAHDAEKPFGSSYY